MLADQASKKPQRGVIRWQARSRQKLKHQEEGVGRLCNTGALRSGKHLVTVYSCIQYTKTYFVIYILAYCIYENHLLLQCLYEAYHPHRQHSFCTVDDIVFDKYRIGHVE